ncbi:hypothetical protein [[Mycobacterium] crassicus]|uniref:Uncharacterized protein n=1 Tax=[Mycobacterium] crassicus TaxID=2872309 RepID=A0ABU5XGR7_9MYCO|nr:hypothetical protein [Mycolicibacter sp. MYC098]MEB3021309.1 hypothetical protein [Mycolicibacter sp. MYC098]
MLDRLGGQRVGIGRTVPASTLNEFRRSAGGTDVTVWVANCLFEIQDSTGGLATIRDTETRTVLEVAWCLMPVSRGMIPAVDRNGQAAPIAVADVTADCWLEFGGKKFPVQSRASLEYDDEGREDHVFCIGQRNGG